MSLVLKNEDRWICNDDESIEYSVRSAYRVLRGEKEGGTKQLYSSFWMIKVLPSTHVNAWRVLENKLATKANLKRRGIELKSILCCLCGANEETTSHLFFCCKIALLVWNICFEWLGLSSTTHHTSVSRFLQYT